MYKFNRLRHLDSPLKIVSKNKLVSECFKFISKEGLDIIKNILNDNEVRTKCEFSSKIAPKVYRGLYQNNQFIRDLWNCSEVDNILSNTMDTELILHPMLYERAHVNFNVKNNLMNENVFDWHYDSQPYVFITLLDSEEKDNVNTQYIYDGKLYNLSFPEPGYSYIMKGSQLKHCVIGSNSKRISMVTSLVPKSIEFEDNTNLNISRTYTPYNDLVLDFINYKVNRMERLLSSNLNNVSKDLVLKEIDDIKKEI